MISFIVLKIFFSVRLFVGRCERNFTAFSALRNFAQLYITLHYFAFDEIMHFSILSRLFYRAESDRRERPARRDASGGPTFFMMYHVPMIFTRYSDIMPWWYFVVHIGDHIITSSCGEISSRGDQRDRREAGRRQRQRRHRPPFNGFCFLPYSLLTLSLDLDFICSIPYPSFKTLPRTMNLKLLGFI